MGLGDSAVPAYGETVRRPHRIQARNSLDERKFEDANPNSVDVNTANLDRFAETYRQLHRQHGSTWAFEVVLRPWVEIW